MKRLWIFIILAVLCGLVHAVMIRSNQTFTYQGRLYDDGSPLDGIVDIVLYLWDGSDPNISEIVAVFTALDHPVSDGYVTLNVNFEYDPVWEAGEIFDGSDRWMEIGVRDGQLEDPNEYQALSPLIKLEATPFAHVAYRLKTPAALRSETTEPTLTVGNAGDGAAVYFEDTEGSVEYSYDAVTNVAHDSTLHVGNSQSVTINANSTEQVMRDQDVSVGMNRTTSVGAADEITVGLGRTTTIGGIDETTVGVHHLNVAAGSITHAGGTIAITNSDGIIVLSSPNLVRLQEGFRVYRDPNDLLTIDGAMTMGPMVEVPPATAGYGKVFVSNVDGKLYYIDTGGAVHDVTAVTDARISFSVKRDSSYAWPGSSSFETIDFDTGTSVWDNTGGGYSTKNSQFIARRMGCIRFMDRFSLRAWRRAI